MNDANDVATRLKPVSLRPTSSMVSYVRHAAVAPDVVCTRRFDAPCERVFGAWVDPPTVSRWLFTTATSELHRAEFEPWAGGNWTVVDRRDGQYFAATGQYLEIERPHRVVLTFGMLQLSAEFVRVVVDIARAGTGCELTLTHEYLPWMGSRSPEKAWHSMFDMLAPLLL